MSDNATAVPLSPALIACGVHVASCSYFPSKTVPLKVVFSTESNKETNNNAAADDKAAQEDGEEDEDEEEGGGLEMTSSTPPPAPRMSLPVIFKVGDDIRQDMLTMQMIRVMDKLWLQEGLDLEMVTFACVPTGDRQGMVEMVTEAKTLREIQVSPSENFAKKSE